MILGGVWFVLNGRLIGAITMLVLAALALVSLVVLPLATRHLGRPIAAASVEVTASVEACTRASIRALEVVSGGGEVKGDNTNFFVEVPESFKTWGERISCTLHQTESGIQIAVKSECLSPQLFDSGRNRANVASVVEHLRAALPDESADG